MSYWLHRISWHAEVSYPLLDLGYISIGFSDLSNPQMHQIVDEQDWHAFENEFSNAWGNIPRNRYTLWRFIAEMKKDDLVVVPTSGAFSVYKVVEDKFYIIEELDAISKLTDWHNNKVIIDKEGYLSIGKPKGEAIDLGFFRKVVPVAVGISREDFADRSLTARMKIRSTTADITDIESSIDEALRAYSQNTPINVHGILLEKLSETVLDVVRSQLNPDNFEKLVQWYFKKIYASSVDIPPKNERGKEGDADIVATFENIKCIVYVQVKHHHEGETSSWAVEQVRNYKNQKESMDDGYSKSAWVISSATNFSQDTIEDARSNHVHLINGKDFSKMLIEVGFQTLDQVL